VTGLSAILQAGSIFERAGLCARFPPLGALSWQAATHRTGSARDPDL